MNNVPTFPWLRRCYAKLKSGCVCCVFFVVFSESFWGAHVGSPAAGCNAECAFSNWVPQPEQWRKWPRHHARLTCLSLTVWTVPQHWLATTLFHCRVFFPSCSKIFSRLAISSDFRSFACFHVFSIFSFFEFFDFSPTTVVVFFLILSSFFHGHFTKHMFSQNFHIFMLSHVFRCFFIVHVLLHFVIFSIVFKFVCLFFVHFFIFPSCPKSCFTLSRVRNKHNRDRHTHRTAPRQGPWTAALGQNPLCPNQLWKICFCVLWPNLVNSGLMAHFQTHHHDSHENSPGDEHSTWHQALAPRHAGPRSPSAPLWADLGLEHRPQFHDRTSKRGKKARNWWSEREKRSEIWAVRRERGPAEGLSRGGPFPWTQIILTTPTPVRNTPNNKQNANSGQTRSGQVRPWPMETRWWSGVRGEDE